MAHSSLSFFLRCQIRPGTPGRLRRDRGLPRGFTTSGRGSCMASRLTTDRRLPAEKVVAQDRGRGRRRYLHQPRRAHRRTDLRGAGGGPLKDRGPAVPSLWLLQRRSSVSFCREVWKVHPWPACGLGADKVPPKAVVSTRQRRSHFHRETAGAPGKHSSHCPEAPRTLHQFHDRGVSRAVDSAAIRCGERFGSEAWVPFKPVRSGYVRSSRFSNDERHGVSPLVGPEPLTAWIVRAGVLGVFRSYQVVRGIVAA